MKKIVSIFLLSALVFSACESKKKNELANADPEISFEYREVANDKYDNHKFEFRNTSIPEITQPYYWYYFQDAAIAIGSGGDRYYNALGTYSVTVLYKPGVTEDPDDILKSKDFTITITGVEDSVWRAATPIEK